MSLDVIIFVISAIVAVFGATMMIAQRNAVASVLYLILSLVAQAVLYIQLNALFLAALLIIIYTGAILVLFLFVIMLLNLRGSEELVDKSSSLGRVTKYLVSFLLVLELVFVVRSSFFPSSVGGGVMTSVKSTGFGSVEGVATLLFTRYLYPFELTSILLLAAIVGAVVMAKRERNATAPAPREDNVTEEVKR